MAKPIKRRGIKARKTADARIVHRAPKVRKAVPFEAFVEATKTTHGVLPPDTYLYRETHIQKIMAQEAVEGDALKSMKEIIRLANQTAALEKAGRLTPNSIDKRTKQIEFSACRMATESLTREYQKQNKPIPPKFPNTEWNPRYFECIMNIWDFLPTAIHVKIIERIRKK
ncbi:MAG: hypothetical protein NUV67_00140 [archaeon]|nr:hypothetical protein [archaeon]